MCCFCLCSWYECLDPPRSQVYPGLKSRACHILTSCLPTSRLCSALTVIALWWSTERVTLLLDTFHQKQPVNPSHSAEKHLYTPDTAPGCGVRHARPPGALRARSWCQLAVSDAAARSQDTETERNQTMFIPEQWALCDSVATNQYRIRGNPVDNSPML